MRMERAATGPRRPHRSRWRGWLLAPGVALLLGLVLWGALSGPDRRPSERPFGAGLPPVTAERTMPTLPEPDPLAIARRAEIAAEEARLAALRAARLELEREVAALEQETAARRSLPPPQEPVTPPIRAVVHHRANSPAASGAAAELAQALRDGGFEVQGLRSTAFVPSTPVVRFFHEEDRAAASRLAARLGPGWAIQDFRAYLPQPAPRTLEVWLAAE
jgi:hypothetical protein